MHLKLNAFHFKQPVAPFGMKEWELRDFDPGKQTIHYKGRPVKVTFYSYDRNAEDRIYIVVDEGNSEERTITLKELQAHGTIVEK